MSIQRRDYLLLGGIFAVFAAGFVWAEWSARKQAEAEYWEASIAAWDRAQSSRVGGKDFSAEGLAVFVHATSQRRHAERLVYAAEIFEAHAANLARLSPPPALRELHLTRMRYAEEGAILMRKAASYRDESDMVRGDAPEMAPLRDAFLVLHDGEAAAWRAAEPSFQRYLEGIKSN